MGLGAVCQVSRGAKPGNMRVHPQRPPQALKREGGSWSIGGMAEAMPFHSRSTVLFAGRRLDPHVSRKPRNVGRPSAAHPRGSGGFLVSTPAFSEVDAVLKICLHAAEEMHPTLSLLDASCYPLFV